MTTIREKGKKILAKAAESTGQSIHIYIHRLYNHHY